MNKWTDSLELAEETGKDHYNVLKDIRNEMATKDLEGGLRKLLIRQSKARLFSNTT